MMRSPRTSNSRLAASPVALCALWTCICASRAASAIVAAPPPTPVDAAAVAGSAATLNPAVAATHTTLTEARSAIKSARLKQNAAIANHRIDEIASYWTDDVTICRGLGFQLAGKAAYRKLFAADDPTSPEQIVYERIPTSIDVGAVWPLAFETGHWKGHQGSAHGPVVIQGRYSAQWVNRSGQWLIRSEVFVALAGSGPGLKMQAAP